MAETPRGRWLLFLLPFSSVLVLGFGATLVGPTLRSLEGGLEWWQGSLLASAIFLGISGSALATGRLGERRGFHRTLPLGVAILCLSLAALTLGSGGGFYPVFSGFLILGVSFGAIQASANPLVPRLFPERPGAALNLLHAAWSIGAFAGPTLAGYYASRGDLGSAFRVGLLLSGLFLLGSLALSRRFPAEPPASAGAREPLPVSPALVLLVLAGFFYFGSEMSINGWLPTYLGSGGLGEAEAGVVLGLFWGLMGVGRVVLGPLVDRLGPRRMLLGLIPAALLLYGASIIRPGASALLLWPLAGFLYSVMFPGIMVLTGRRFPGRPGAAMGSVFTFGIYGAVLFPALLGGLVSSAGAWVVPAVVAASIGGMGVVVLMLREARVAENRD